MEKVAHGLANAIARRKVKAVVLLIALLILAALFTLYTVLKIAIWIIGCFFRLLRDVALKAHANQQSQQPKAKARVKKPKPKVKVKAMVHRRHHAPVHPFVWLELARMFERGGRLPRHPRQKPN